MFLLRVKNHFKMELMRFSQKDVKLRNLFSPRILDILELCMSGHALSIFLLSSLAHTMKAFIGLLMCGFDSPSFFVCRMIFAPTILPINKAYSSETETHI